MDLLLVAHAGGGTIAASAAAGGLTLFLFADQIYHNQRYNDDQHEADNDIAEIGCTKCQHKFPLL